jgi:hypothetical protein
MGPAQKEGHTMTAEEKRRVFGLEPRALPSPMELINKSAGFLIQ